MRRSCMVVILTIGLISISGRVYAQTSNTFPWPMTGQVGIGTKLDPPFQPQNALHIHYDPADTGTRSAMIRLSEGDSANMQYYGLLGLMPLGTTTYSSLSTGDDLILHDNQGGDIIITNYSTPAEAFEHGTAIRLATTGDMTQRPATPSFPHDLERETILGNGNIGFDLPPNATTGLSTPLDQVQIGGGSIPPPGYLDPVPGLTLYGGNRFEGMLEPLGDTGMYPVDWRYIGFNFGINHAVTDSSRFFRMGRMGASIIRFWGGTGGGLELSAYPYDSIRDAGTAWLHDVTHYLSLNMNGQQGLSLWTYENGSDQYHHLIDIWRPGFLPYGTTRNTSGLTILRTPVLIDTEPNAPDFTNFAHVRPDIGDGLTWMLAVNGPMLAKEIFVLDSTWADYVFDPGYKLPPLGEVENFVKANRHLPDIEPASKIAKTGVPVGRTEEALTKKVEELTLYVIDQNKKIEQLEADLQELRNEKEK